MLLEVVHNASKLSIACLASNTLHYIANLHYKTPQLRDDFVNQNGWISENFGNEVVPHGEVLYFMFFAMVFSVVNYTM